jgi:predicted nucleic acid-binding Zn ribbon protein
MEERCIVCGAIIPEGRQICPNCEKAVSRKEGRVKRMISAWWLIPAIMAGAMLGVFFVILCSMGR